jgi:hypothetical protein
MLPTRIPTNGNTSLTLEESIKILQAQQKSIPINIEKVINNEHQKYNTSIPGSNLAFYTLFENQYGKVFFNQRMKTYYNSVSEKSRTQEGQLRYFKNVDKFRLKTLYTSKKKEIKGVTANTVIKELRKIQLSGINGSKQQQQLGTMGTGRHQGPGNLALQLASQVEQNLVGKVQLNEPYRLWFQKTNPIIYHGFSTNQGQHLAPGNFIKLLKNREKIIQNPVIPSYENSFLNKILDKNMYNRMKTNYENLQKNAKNIKIHKFYEYIRNTPKTFSNSLKQNSISISGNLLFNRTFREQISKYIGKEEKYQDDILRQLIKKYTQKYYKANTKQDKTAYVKNQILELIKSFETKKNQSRNASEKNIIDYLAKLYVKYPHASRRSFSNYVDHIKSKMGNTITKNTNTIIKMLNDIQKEYDSQTNKTHFLEFFIKQIIIRERLSNFNTRLKNQNLTLEKIQKLRKNILLFKKQHKAANTKALENLLLIKENNIKPSKPVAPQRQTPMTSNSSMQVNMMKDRHKKELESKNAKIKKLENKIKIQSQGTVGNNYVIINGTKVENPSAVPKFLLEKFPGTGSSLVWDGIKGKLKTQSNKEKLFIYDPTKFELISKNMLSETLKTQTERQKETNVINTYKNANLNKFNTNIDAALDYKTLNMIAYGVYTYSNGTLNSDDMLSILKKIKNKRTQILSDIVSEKYGMNLKTLPKNNLYIGMISRNESVNVLTKDMKTALEKMQKEIKQYQKITEPRYHLEDCMIIILTNVISTNGQVQESLEMAAITINRSKSLHNRWKISVQPSQIELNREVQRARQIEVNRKVEEKKEKILNKGKQMQTQVGGRAREIINGTTNQPLL